jgi:hypothetical protein
MHFYNHVYLCWRSVIVFDSHTSKEPHEFPNKSCWWKVLGKSQVQGIVRIKLQSELVIGFIVFK